MLENVSRMAVAGQVIEQIKQMFLSGELQPDQRLPEESELAKKLAANRTGLREALRALEHGGVLVARPDGALYVTDAATLRGHVHNLSAALKLYAHWEVVEVRKIVEVAAVALAVRCGKPSELQAMREAHEIMRLAVDNSQRFVLADVTFHRTITDAAGNSMLDSLLQDVWGMTSGFNLELLITRPERERVIAQHEQILQFIETGKPEDAARTLEAHLDSMVAIMRRQYDEEKAD